MKQIKTKNGNWQGNVNKIYLAFLNFYVVERQD